MKSHHISVAFKGEMTFEANISGHKVKVDTTADEGGSNSAPSPKRLMLASLAGCTGMDVVMILNKMKVPFSEFDIELEAGLSDEVPSIYNQARLTYKIKIAPENRPKMEKAVALSQEKYCSVSAMFRKFCELSYTIEYR